MASGVGAVEPGMFGLGPVPAVYQALDRAGWSIGDIQRAEINEAFAAIAIALTEELGLSEDIVNVDGGAIALGHPIGGDGGDPDDAVASFHGPRRREPGARDALYRRRTGHRPAAGTRGLGPSEPTHTKG